VLAPLLEVIVGEGERCGIASVLSRALPAQLWCSTGILEGSLDLLDLLLPKLVVDVFDAPLGYEIIFELPMNVVVSVSVVVAQHYIDVLGELHGGVLAVIDKLDSAHRKAVRGDALRCAYEELHRWQTPC
jgi:hypothetical protein